MDEKKSSVKSQTDTGVRSVSFQGFGRTESMFVWECVFVCSSLISDIRQMRTNTHLKSQLWLSTLETRPMPRFPYCLYAHKDLWKSKNWMKFYAYYHCSPFPTISFPHMQMWVSGRAGRFLPLRRCRPGKEPVYFFPKLLLSVSFSFSP